MRIKIFCAGLEKNYVQDLKKLCTGFEKIMYKIFLNYAHKKFRTPDTGSRTCGNHGNKSMILFSDKHGLYCIGTAFIVDTRFRRGS